MHQRYEHIDWLQIGPIYHTYTVYIYHTSCWRLLACRKRFRERQLKDART